MTAGDAKPTVLHYLGYDDDRGGIVAVVRALATADRFRCVLGMNAGYVPARAGELPIERFTPLAGERLGPATAWRARRVAEEVRRWLAADPARVFHGHSRAALAVAAWLRRAGERRVVVSVHCYGRQRWFYRLAARRLGHRLYWLSPAMKDYYGVGEASTWAQCIPGCVSGGPRGRSRARDSAESVVVAGVGALVPWKRWDLVLAALRQMPEAVRRRLRFVHVGGSDGSAASVACGDALRRQTAADGLGDVVSWRGEAASSAAVLGEADALVVASEREPLSVAMLEALFAGVPVLAADSGGARDVVTDGRNGRLFRSGNAADLARVLTEVAEGAAGRLRPEPEDLAPFTAAAVAAQWEDVYARVGRAG